MVGRRQLQRVDVPVRARTTHDGLLHKRLEEDLSLNRPPCSPVDPIGPGTETDLLGGQNDPTEQRRVIWTRFTETSLCFAQVGSWLAFAAHNCTA